MKSQQSAVSWVLGDFRNSRNIVGLLEGFSGLGKTTVAASAVKAWQGPTCVITAPHGALLEDLLFDVAATLEQNGDRSIADTPSGSFEAGTLEKLKQEKFLLVIDNFENLLNERSGLAPSRITRFLTNLQKVPAAGKVLLLSSKMPASDGWLDASLTKTLGPPNSADAVEFLSRLLEQRSFEDEVPEELLPDVVDWLGRNPRALQAFVTCLAAESFDELVEADKEAWDLRSGNPSRTLLESLEERFWHLTLGRLSAEARSLVSSLAVLRRPFKGDLINVVFGGGPSWETARNELRAHFILDRITNYYSLNAVVHRITLTDLRRDPRRTEIAHGRAATYFSKRAGIGATGKAMQVGSSFVEARYHLARCDREHEIESLAQQIRPTLQANLRRLQLDATSPEVAREMIPVLMGILDNDVAKLADVRHMLVDLLLLRGKQGDDTLALRQANTACRESRDPNLWRTYAMLASRLESSRYLERLADRATATLTEGQSLVTRVIALELNNRGEGQLALSCLDLAKTRVNAREQVYLHSIRAFIDDSHGRSARASAYLLESFQHLPEDTLGRSRLIEEASFIAYRAGHVESLDLLESASESEKPVWLPILPRVLRLMLAGNFEAAIDLTHGIVDSAALSAQAAFGLLALGKPREARVRLAEVSYRNNRSNLWLSAIVALCCRDTSTYTSAVSDFLGRAPTELELADPALILRLWDLEPTTQEPYPGFYFSRIPASLSGLDLPLVFRLGQATRLALVPISTVKFPVLVSAEDDEVTRAAVAVNLSDGGLPQLTQIGNFYMGDTSYTSHGPVGAMGDSAVNNGPVSMSGSVPLPKLVEAIDNLLIHARMSQGPSDKTATASLESAKRDLEEGRHQEATAALTSSAKWLGDKISNVAVGVSAQLLLKSLGY